ncbi:MAG: serine hydrolase [Bacteroidota bacterium]
MLSVFCGKTTVIALYCFVYIQHALFALPSEAELPITNGAVAYAYPVSSIVVDGNPSDWPSILKKHPITIAPYGTVPEKNDFEAYFQVGHNLSEQALYILVTVIDNDHMVDNSENASWRSQDTYSLYLDPKHQWEGSGVSLLQFAENLQEDYDYTGTWDEDAKIFGWDKVTMKTSTTGNVTTYEIKASLGKYLKLNRSIGLDHVLIDRDSDDEGDAMTFMSWGRFGGKSQSASRLGDVIPLAKATKIADVSGKVKWANDTIEKVSDRIALFNAKQDDSWTVVKVDSLGNYNAKLPEGSYVAKPYWDYYDDHMIEQGHGSSTFTVKDQLMNRAAELAIKTKAPLDYIPNEGIIENFNPNDPAKLDDFIAAYQDHYTIPGVSLAIIKEGKVVYHKTYGYKNYVTKAPVVTNTLFEAASITKPVFAFAVCRLAERGVIDLDRPLHTYLPFEDIAYDERYKLITARHVLSHQTGFPNWANGKIELKFTPGTGYGYSGEGFEYLKRVVMEITGKDMNTVMEEEVLKPLSLKNTYFMGNDYVQANVSHGHNGRFPTKANLPTAPGMAWSMHTEALSFASFALGLNERKGLKPETYKEMFKIQTVVDNDEDTREGWERYFGLGISMEKTPFGPTFGHGGNNGDFKCLFKIYTDLNAGFIVFTNSSKGDQLHSALNQFLFTGKEKS